jgi:ATP-dependent Clp protease protease subunit
MPMDVYEKLAGDRILFITGPIIDSMAADISATLLLKDYEDQGKKITIFINSDGGSIRNALMIYDMMQMISSPIETICTGVASSEAVVLLLGGAPGMRLATKNAIISVSQLENNYTCQVDMINVNKIMKMTEEDNKRMMNILAKSTNKNIKQVMLDFDRRVFFTAEKARKYGLIDKIVGFIK